MNKSTPDFVGNELLIAHPSMRFLGLWSLSEDGTCRCGRAGCDRPGKHPFDNYATAARNFDPPVKFRGWRDAVPWNVWDRDYSMLTWMGGRTAAAVPDDLWVLDSDSDAAFRELVGLFVSGAVTFDRVMGVCRTPRGFHVWITTEHAGWRLGSAAASLKKFGCVALEAKSLGGYAVFPTEADEHSPDRNRGWVSGHWFEMFVFIHSIRVFSGGVGPSFTGTLAAEVPPQKTERQHYPEGYVLPGDEFANAWANLEYWCTVLVSQTVGRNIALNRTAYMSGRRAIAAGHPREVVAAMLRRAGLASGLRHGETERTTRSGLGGGWS